jgi:hypothetical protein
MKNFRMVCFGSCNPRTKETNWSPKGIIRSENQPLSECPVCKSVLVKKFDKQRKHRVKDKKRKSRPEAERGFKLQGKEYI